jgi:hypothetical protein
MCDKKSMQGMTQVPRLRMERVNPTFSETNTGFSSDREAQGFSTKLESFILLRAPYMLK